MQTAEINKTFFGILIQLIFQWSKLCSVHTWTTCCQPHTDNYTYDSAKQNKHLNLNRRSATTSNYTQLWSNVRNDRKLSLRAGRFVTPYDTEESGLIATNLSYTKAKTGSTACILRTGQSRLHCQRTRETSFLRLNDSHFDYDTTTSCI